RNPETVLPPELYPKLHRPRWAVGLGFDPAPRTNPLASTPALEAFARPLVRADRPVRPECLRRGVSSGPRGRIRGPLGPEARGRGEPVSLLPEGVAGDACGSLCGSSARAQPEAKSS